MVIRQPVGAREEAQARNVRKKREKKGGAEGKERGEERRPEKGAGKVLKEESRTLRRPKGRKGRSKEEGRGKGGELTGRAGCWRLVTLSVFFH